jgi:hypothetical protein
MAAARKMADLARLDRNGTEAPASAVLQVVCAIEAFETSWKLFRSQEAASLSWRQDKKAAAATPGKAKEGKAAFGKARVTHSWHEMVMWTFGEGWEPSEQGRKDIDALFLLRNDLIHSNGGPEQVVPEPDATNRHVTYFRERGLPIRPMPACWADRVLTPELAEWAIQVAASQMAEVRKAYADLMDSNAIQEASPEAGAEVEESWPVQDTA